MSIPYSTFTLVVKTNDFYGVIVMTVLVSLARERNTLSKRWS